MIVMNNIYIFTVCPVPDKVENASVFSPQTDWIEGEGFEYKCKKQFPGSVIFNECIIIQNVVQWKLSLKNGNLPTCLCFTLALKYLIILVNNFSLHCFFGLAYFLNTI